MAPVSVDAAQVQRQTTGAAAAAGEGLPPTGRGAQRKRAAILRARRSPSPALSTGSQNSMTEDSEGESPPGSPATKYAACNDLLHYDIQVSNDIFRISLHDTLARYPGDDSSSSLTLRP